MYNKTNITSKESQEFPYNILVTENNIAEFLKFKELIIPRFYYLLNHLNIKKPYILKIEKNGATIFTVLELNGLQHLNG